MRKAHFLLFTVTVLIGLISCGQSGNDLDRSWIPADNGEKKIYINIKGETVLTPEAHFDEINFFYNGRACVSIDGNKGFIDKTGKAVIPCKYRSATHFADGLAWVVETDGYPIAIDPSGKMIIEKPTAYQVSSFVDGLAIFQDKATLLFGVVDCEGKDVILPKYDELMLFSSCLIGVKIENGLWGFMDKEEKIVITPQFEAISRFSNKNYMIVTVSDRKGVINKEGEYVIKPAFQDIIPDGDLFLVQASNDLFGWVNTNDQYVINPQYTFVRLFDDNDIVPVSTTSTQNKKTLQMGYINKKGEEKIRPQFEFATHFYNGVAMIRIGDKYGFINKNGNIVVNPRFNHVEFPSPLMIDLGRQSIYSDYFDHNAIIYGFIDIPQDGTFRGFDKATTFAMLKAKYGAKFVRRTHNSCKLTEEIILSDDASITETIFNFNKDLESHDYNFYTKKHETTTHNDAQIASIKFKLNIKKNKDKRDGLQSKLVEKLATMPMMSYDQSCDSSGDVFSEKMTFVVNPGSRGEIVIDVVFN